MLDFGGIQIDSSNIDGQDSDTVGFGGGIFYGDGIPTTYDSTSFSITIGPIDSSMAGKTITLDSCTYEPNNEWFWVDTTSTVIYDVPWGGPYVYTIEDPELLYCSGKVIYTNPRPDNGGTSARPSRRTLIQMWEAEDFLPDDSMATVYTNDTGGFYFLPVDNDDGAGQGGLDIYYKVLAENDAAVVYDTLYEHRFQYESTTQNNLSSGNNIRLIGAPSPTYTAIDTNGGFFIADQVLEAHDKWDSLIMQDLDQLSVVAHATWPPGTGYKPDSNYMKIEMYVSGSYPDNYDTDVLYHEYGHYIEDSRYFFDSSYGGPHYPWGIYYPGLAANEGFCHFISAVFLDDSISTNYNNNFTWYIWHNVENGEFDVGDSAGWVNNYGGSNEIAVAGLLWDIYDAADDDFSTYYYPSLDSLPHFSTNSSDPDSIGDSLSLSFSSVFSPLRHDHTDGYYPDDIMEYWAVWNTSSLSYKTALNDIFYEHGIEMYKCGDTNVDNEINLADAIFLINHIFRSGPGPSPYYLGNANGDDSLNIGDVINLVNFVFKSGPAPTGCENII